MVILLHVSAEYVIKGQDTLTYDSSFWIGNVLDSFSRASVPLFVLISGMFLLGRTESFRDFYRKRASRILRPLVFWSVIYSAYRLAGTYFIKGITGITLAKTAVTELPFYHLWYLFMLVGLYLISPLLNIVIAKCTTKELWKVAIALLGLGMLNNGYGILTGGRPIFLLWFIDFIGYFLLGYLIMHSKKTYPAALLLLTFIASGVLISALSFYTAKHFDHLYFYSYLSPLVVIGALSFFKFFLQLNLKENVLSQIAYLSLGIYLIHAGLLNFLVIGLKYSKLTFLDNPLIGIPIKFTFAFFSALAISWLFSKSKLLKKVI